jgi:hypothetical protein
MPEWMYLAISSAAETTYDMSGSFVLRSGVGTQMSTASISASFDMSVVARSRPALTLSATSAVLTSPM